MSDHPLKNYPYAPVSKTTQSKPNMPSGPKSPKQSYADDPGDGGYKISGPNKKGD